jgi:syntaxin 16
VLTSGRYQANTGRRKCILFLILIIVGLVIVLIYKPRSSADNPVIPHTPDSITTITPGMPVEPSGGYRPNLPKPPPLPMPTSMTENGDEMGESWER